MLNEPFKTPQGITITTDFTRTEAPPIPSVVIAALGAQAETLKRIGVTQVSRRTDSRGQEFYVSLGNASTERREEVRQGLQAVSDAASGSKAIAGRSPARLTYASFTIPAVV